MLSAYLFTCHLLTSLIFVSSIGFAIYLCSGLKCVRYDTRGLYPQSVIVWLVSAGRSRSVGTTLVTHNECTEWISAMQYSAFNYMKYSKLKIEMPHIFALLCNLPIVFCIAFDLGPEGGIRGARLPGWGQLANPSPWEPHL